MIQSSAQGRLLLPSRSCRWIAAAWLLTTATIANRPSASLAAEPITRSTRVAELLPITAMSNEAHSQHDDARHTPIVRAIEHSEAAVVNIQGNKTISTAGGQNGPIKQEVSGMGTGVIIDPRGYIITNLHVVQDVPRIEVTLADGQSERAELINYDLETDLALIKINARRPLAVIPFGTSNDLLRGETVIAIGNPFGYQNTVTIGVISALHRDVPVNGSQQYRDLIQTSADINPGNSGGPLLNINGEVIGINVAVRVGAQGIGFAIPIDQAIDVMADLVAAQRRNSLSHGISLQRQIDANGTHWKVDAVDTNPVRKASSRRNDGVAISSDELIQPGDLLVSVEGSNAPAELALELALIDKAEGDLLPVNVQRNGLTVRTAIRMEAKSEAMLVSASAEASEVGDLAWTQLGLRLNEVDAQAVRTSGESYQGGLRVTQIRAGSPAAKQKISVGDSIVGVLNWQTPNWAALKWVLENNDLRNQSSTKFYVVRNNKTFYVAMDLAQSSGLR